MRHLDDTVHRVDSERITSLVNAFNLLKEKIYEPAEQLSGADELEELVVDVLLRDAELFSHCRGAHLKIEYKYWNTVKQPNVSYHLQRISLVKFNFTIVFFSKKKRKLAKYRLIRSQILLVGLATHRSRVEVVVRRQVAVEFQLKFWKFSQFYKMYKFTTSCTTLVFPEITTFSSLSESPFQRSLACLRWPSV